MCSQRGNWNIFTIADNLKTIVTALITLYGVVRVVFEEIYYLKGK